MNVIYEKLYDEIAFTPPDLRAVRTRRPRKFIRELGEPRIVEPKEEFMDERYLLLAHDPEYVERLKAFRDIKEPVPLDYDTYAYPGFFDHVLHYVAGTLTALEVALQEGHAFNTQGGLHHAHRDRSGGFCPVNDVAIAALYAYEQGYRVAVVDYDAHHGDGTQEILYDKDILHISVHDYGIYPGTGRLTEMGVGKGLGYNVNIPLRHFSADDSAALAADLIRKLLESYNPDVIIVQSGADGRHGDPLTTLRYSVHAFIEYGKALRDVGARLVFTAGGGYTDAVPKLRKAAYLTAIGKEVEPFEKRIPDQNVEGTQEVIAEIVERLRKLGIL